MGALRTLVVWCPDWPVTATAAPPGAAVAVMAGNRVVACSAAARAEGVRRGLRRRQAEACCPGLVVVPCDRGAEARAFEPVVAAVEELSPRVEIVRPGVCAVATRGPSRYFGGDAALATRITAQVEAVLLPGVPRCRVGVADGRFAARLAARQVAPGASSLVVPPGESASFLASFPVATLEEEAPALADLLLRLGIRTLGDLAALPAKAVLARFGPEGVGAHRLARGLDEYPLAGRTPPPDLVVTAELDPPAERVDTIAFVARTLAARLVDELRARGLAVAGLRIEVETEHGESRSRCWRLDHSTTPVTAATLAERVRWQLDGWLTATDRLPGLSGRERGQSPITLLRLVPEEVRADRGCQQGFWGGDRAAAERAGRALERVQGRLGPEAVATAVVAGGRAPAEQVRLVSWGDPRPLDPAAASPWPGKLPLPAPATVLHVPRSAEVVDVEGNPVSVSGRGTVSAPPFRLSLADGRWIEIVAWAGPWPVDERWWDPKAHRRLAHWQVITANGAAYLLCLEGGQWQLEAIYD